MIEFKSKSKHHNPLLVWWHIFWRDEKAGSEISFEYWPKTHKAMHFIRIVSKFRAKTLCDTAVNMHYNGVHTQIQCHVNKMHLICIYMCIRHKVWDRFSWKTPSWKRTPCHTNSFSSNLPMRNIYCISNSELITIHPPMSTYITYWVHLCFDELNPRSK